MLVEKSNFTVTPSYGGTPFEPLRFRQAPSEPTGKTSGDLGGNRRAGLSSARSWITLRAHHRRWGLLSRARQQ